MCGTCPSIPLFVVIDVKTFELKLNNVKNVKPSIMKENFSKNGIKKLIIMFTQVTNNL